MRVYNLGGMLPVTVAYAAPVEHGKHLLDIYRPSRAGRHSVVIFIHGGGLTEGDRTWYRAVGASLAAGGYVAVIPSYRYYPATNPIGSARDIIDAVRWTATHIAHYGGNPKRIILIGHSAGGWMVDLAMMNHQLWIGTGFSHAPVAAAAYLSGDFADITYPARGESAADRAADRKLLGPPGESRARFSPDRYPPADVPWLLVCATRDDAGACGDRDAYAAALHHASIPVTVFTDRGTHMGEVEHLRTIGSQFRTVFDAWALKVMCQ